MPSSLEVYGPGVRGTGLANSLLGSSTGALKWSIRFRAPVSSTLVTVRYAHLGSDEPGYGGGSSGTINISLQADDGTDTHAPSGTPLAEEDLAALDDVVGGRLITFSPAGSVVAGQLYHIVFENTDATPNTNWSSINNWYCPDPDTAPDRLIPRFPPLDWAMLYESDSVWHERATFIPILDIGFGNGTHHGQCFGEAAYYADGYPEDQMVGRVGGSSLVRERFTPTSNMTIAGFGVSVMRDADTTGGLTVSLVQVSTGEVLLSRRVPFHMLHEGPVPLEADPPTADDAGQHAGWLRGFLPVPVTLTSGVEYAFQLSSPAGGTFWTWPLRDLSDEYDYDASTGFPDGVAEYSDDGGATWDEMGRVQGEFDLPFYLLRLVSS